MRIDSPSGDPTPVQAKESPSPLQKILNRYDIRLTLGPIPLQKAHLQGKDLGELADQYNAGHKTWVVADDLNPTVINPKEVQAFLETFVRLSPDQLEKLRGQTLDLSQELLRLRYADGIGEQRLKDGYSLSVRPAEGKAPAEVTLLADPDLHDLDRTIRRSQEEIAGLEPQVQELAREIARLGPGEPSKGHELLHKSYQARARLAETQRVMREAVRQAIEVAQKEPDRQIRVGDRTYTLPQLGDWLKQLERDLEKAPAPPGGLGAPPSL